MKNIIFVIAVIFSFVQCSSPNSNDNNFDDVRTKNTLLPKVLFITTGLNFVEKDLPKGVIVALHTFNKRGIPVRLEARDVLFNYNFLSNYSIIILSTARGYHDADRMYSLTYMTDAELRNLSEYVKSGGVLIAGDNVGRNYFDGGDRVADYQQLNEKNYPLTDAFGFTMKEQNMRGFKISGNITKSLKGDFLPKVEDDLWTLTPEEVVSDNLKVLASWVNAGDTVPAIIQNNYGKGSTYLFSSSDFIKPVSSGGYWSISQITDFYNYVADEYYARNNIELSLNPWPNAHDAAFCATFNAVGELANYKYLLKRLSELDIKPTFFVNGLVNDSIKEFLQSNDIDLASTGYHYFNYDNLNYPIALNDILQNENKWNKEFKGFRFPYTNPNYTGLLTIDSHNYSFESSISANNLEFLQGCVFPYNIVIANDGFYKSTDVLEIAPSYHDDYFFLGRLLNNYYLTPNQLVKDVMLYKQYLQDFWQYSVKPYNGLMVYIGHPGLVGRNDTTFSALENLISRIKEDNTWITSISELSEYRYKLEKLSFFTQSYKKKDIVYVLAPDGIRIENLSVNLDFNPGEVKAEKGDVEVVKNGERYSIVFDAFDGQKITVMK